MAKLMPLESAALKWYRAYDHLQAFNNELIGFRRTGPCPFSSSIDPQSGRKLWRVDGTPSSPPIRMAPIIGDTLYCFRSCLDHIAHEVTETFGRGATKTTDFPLYDSEHSWKSNQSGKFPGVPEVIVNKIRDHQPAYGGNPARNARLLDFQDLSVIDKHRHLHLSTAATVGGFWDPALPTHSTDWFIHGGVVVHGTVLASLPREYGNVGFLPAFDVCFGPGSRAEGQSVYVTLVGIGEMIADILQDFSSDFGVKLTLKRNF